MELLKVSWRQYPPTLWLSFRSFTCRSMVLNSQQKKHASKRSRLLSCFGSSCALRVDALDSSGADSYSACVLSNSLAAKPQRRMILN